MENERAGLGLLLKQGEHDDHEAIELEANNHLSPVVTGEVLSRHVMLDETSMQVSRPALACSPLLTGCNTLSPSAGLTMVLISPGEALCEGGTL